MKEQDVRQRIEGFLKSMPRAAAIIIAGLVGLACSSSGLKTFPDAGAASGGQAGGTISSGTTGGTGGMIATGAASIGGTGGQAATTDFVPLCESGPGPCNHGDQSVAFQIGNPNATIPPCPAGRECYLLRMGCGYNLCMVPEGVHCSDLLSCNPGDTPIPQVSVGYTGRGYTKQLCMQSIYCSAPSSGYGSICSGAWSDGVFVEQPDASADGEDGGTMPCCGDGIVDQGEQCDAGNLNGLCLDAQGRPVGHPENASCQSLPASCNCPEYPAHTSLSCSTTCQAPIISGAPRCGDGIVETGEDCDCGDGSVPVPTGCSGRNADNVYDGCTTRCSLGPHCGDSIVDTQYGEQCDFGEANGACFDASGNFAGYPGDTGCPAGTDVICTKTCTTIEVDP